MVPQGLLGSGVPWKPCFGNGNNEQESSKVVLPETHSPRRLTRRASIHHSPFSFLPSAAWAPSALQRPQQLQWSSPLKRLTRSASWVHPWGLRQKTSKRATHLRCQNVDDAPVLLAMDRKGGGRERGKGTERGKKEGEGRRREGKKEGGGEQDLSP